MTAEQTIPSKDGTGIYVKQFPVPNPKAQLLVCHGYLEHCLRYTEFAQHLNSNYQIAVTLFDFRGHGRSGGSKAGLGKWTDYEDDLEAVRDTLLPKVPTFILGHSNGGLVLLNYLLAGSSDKQKDLAGVLFSSPYIRPAKDVSLFKVWMAKLMGRLLPSLQVPSDLKASELTSDPEKQKEHDEDANNLTHATIGWAVLCMSTQDEIQELVASVSLEVPVLYTFAGDDQVSNPTVVEDFGSALQAKDKTVAKRDGEQHEILNEVKREEVYKLMGDWILEKTKK